MTFLLDGGLARSPHPRRTRAGRALLVALAGGLATAACSTGEEAQVTRVAVGESELAGTALTASQVRWIDHVHRNVVAKLPGSASERVHTAAVVVWWALKEGALDVKPNPWRHNLCGANVPIGDLETCNAGAWQVGLSAIQPPNVTLAQVEGMARQIYPGVAIPELLGRIADEAGITDAGTRSAITKSSGELEKAWLVRDPAIGIALGPPFIE
jgi:hypothetical protein